MASKRTATGQFAKGVSGNPSGRAKMPDGLADGIRAFCETDGLKRLKMLAKDKDSRIALAAWQLLFDRAYGKPVTPTDIKIEGADLGAAHLAALQALTPKSPSTPIIAPTETPAAAEPGPPPDTMTH